MTTCWLNLWCPNTAVLLGMYNLHQIPIQICVRSWERSRMMKRGGKSNGLKSFERLNVGERWLIILHHHHLCLNLGRRLPFLLSLPIGMARRTLPQAMWIICHQKWSFSHSNPGVIYIVFTGKGQVSAGTISKEKPIPWKHKCRGKGKQVAAGLWAVSLSGVADHHILRLFCKKEAEGPTSEGEINLCE